MLDTVLVKFAGIAKEFSVSSGVDLGFTTINWYGIIIAFGFLLAVLWGGRVAYLWKINLDKMIDVLIFGTLAGIVGARLYYVAFKWDYYSQNLAEIFNIRGGGLAIYGGLIAAIFAGFFVCKYRNLNIYNLLDMCAMSFLIGQGIGRWGNYANQEAFGGFTSSSNWGMMSDKVISYITTHADSYGLSGVDDIEQYIIDNDLYVHPTFFYESIWCLFSFGVLFFMYKKCRKFSGQLILGYGVLYGFERMIVEGMRTDSLYFAGTSIRVSQVLSGVLMVVCLVLFIYLYRKYSKNPKPIEGIDYFPELTEKEKIAAEKVKAKKEAKAKKKAQRKANSKQ